jgi:hypothetical protein
MFAWFRDKENLLYGQKFCFIFASNRIHITLRTYVPYLKLEPINNSLTFFIIFFFIISFL